MTSLFGCRFHLLTIVYSIPFFFFLLFETLLSFQMLDDFVDVTKDEKQMMHMWNSFVRKQRYVLSLFSTYMSSLTVNKFSVTCVNSVWITCVIVLLHELF